MLVQLNGKHQALEQVLGAGLATTEGCDRRRHDHGSAGLNGVLGEADGLPHDGIEPFAVQAHGCDLERQLVPLFCEFVVVEGAQANGTAFTRMGEKRANEAADLFYSATI